MKYLVVALLVLLVTLSSAEDDLLKELDNEVLFDILDQEKLNEEENARDAIQYDTEKRNQVPKDPFCKRRRNGTYVDAFNCEGFIMCSNHLTYFFDCPSNLRYNPKTKRCDWPRNVKCGPKPTKPKPPPTPSPSGFCKNKHNGNYVDRIRARNCEGFIMCSNGYTYFFDCPAKLRFNPKKNQCDWPQNVPCPPYKPTTRPPPTRPWPTRPWPTRPWPKKTEFCRTHRNGKYRDVTNCEGYFICYNGYQIFRDCPGKKRFNPKTLQCDLPRNVKCAGAGGGTRGSKFCKWRRNGNYRDVLNCNGFIMCSNGYTYFMDCPSNLRYNVWTDRCDWPRNVPCHY